MKKTMVFENEEAYENWFDMNEEKEGGHDFIENRVVIVKGYRVINGIKFNGFSADTTIECKSISTAVRRFVKEMNENGYEISVDEFEGAMDGNNLHDMQGSGMVIEVEEVDDGRFYVNYMCYQDEFETEQTEEETTEKTEIPQHETETEEKTEEPKTTSVQWSYFDKFDEVSELYLPSTGEGGTKATQLVTAISKLVYKWYNDGDVYDNTAYMDGWCNDLSSYANWIYSNYSEAQPILDMIYDVYTEAGYEHILKDLADKFLSKEFLSEENKKGVCGSIYDTDGKFRFEDYETEDEDEW